MTDNVEDAIIDDLVKVNSQIDRQTSSLERAKARKESLFTSLKCDHAFESDVGLGEESETCTKCHYKYWS